MLASMKQSVSGDFLISESISKDELEETHENFADAPSEKRKTLGQEVAGSFWQVTESRVENRGVDYLPTAR